ERGQEECHVLEGWTGVSARSTRSVGRRGPGTQWGTLGRSPTSRAVMGGPCAISSQSLRTLPVPRHMRSGGQATTRAKDGLAERLPLLDLGSNTPVGRRPREGIDLGHAPTSRTSAFDVPDRDLTVLTRGRAQAA